MIQRLERLFPALEENNASSPGFLTNALGYATALAGYLFAVLATRPLTLPLFLSFTAANLLWFACFVVLTSYSEGLKPYQVHLLLLGTGVAALWTVLLVFTGMSLDWLLPIVTIVVYIMVYPIRIAVVASSGLMLGTMLLVLLAAVRSGQAPAQILQEQLTLVPAFLYAFSFPLFMRRQHQQRERAEALVSELEAAHAQLRAHADQVEELAISRERNRMAREIHDTLGHYLTILAVQLETALKLEERGDRRLHHELVEARRAAAECLAEVRHSVSALRPTDLTRSTLTEALGRLVREFEAVLPETEIVLDAEGDVDALAPELRVTLYRCAQEALTNVRKHAQAAKVLVRLRMDGGQAELTVLDNGRRAADGEQRTPSGFGLQGIRERIALAGGRVSAGPQPGIGWRVEATLPAVLAEPRPDVPEAPAGGGALAGATPGTGAER